jgi:hypothetical protein
MAAKKKAAANAAKAKPALPPTYDSQTPGERQFVIDTYAQTTALLDRVTDKPKRDAIAAKLKAIRAKFNALPKSKVTKERVARYVEEIVKVGREIV